MQAPVRSLSLAFLLSRPWSKEPSFRSFSSSSSSNYSNQSRGGLPRFYSEILPSSQGSVVRVKGDEFWHMTRVLRLKVNDRVELFNGKGSLVEGCIQEIDQSGLNFVALENPKLVSPLDTQWHVFAAFGTLKGGRADWLVEKCTELGANSITPLLTERSPSISENRVERLLRVSLAAAKQCQRLHEMSLNPPMKVSELIPHVTKSTLSFIALAEAMPVFSALSSRRKESSGLLIIGPEGDFGNLICGGERDPADFTEMEKNMIVDAGATAVGLGPHRLRVETATVALLANLMLWSDHQRLANS
nr:ribosomal RNA small subunit methyltransferase E isoform X1 [Ipomoea batatas]